VSFRISVASLIFSLENMSIAVSAVLKSPTISAFPSISPFVSVSTWFFTFCFWLCWVCISACELSPAAVQGLHVAMHRPPLLQSTSSREHGLSSCSMWDLSFPNQDLNLHPLHCKVDSEPLDHLYSWDCFIYTCSGTCSYCYPKCKFICLIHSEVKQY